MASSNSSQGGGVGFPFLLTLLFIGLKLTHYIDWSWWWVVSPIWITLVLALLVGVVVGVVTYVREK